MRNSPSYYRSQNGNAPVLILIIAGFTAALMIAVIAVASAAFQTHRLNSAIRADMASATIKQVVAEDSLAWADSGAGPVSDILSTQARDVRFKEMAQWAGSATVRDISRGNPTAQIFSSAATLSSSPGGNPSHPFESLSGTITTLGLTVVADEPYAGELNLTPSIDMRETPACDIAFIAAGKFKPDALSIPITVNGIAYFPYGVDNAAEAGKLTASRVVATSVPPAYSAVAARTHVNPVYRGSWGFGSALLLASPSNLYGAGAQLGYFNRAELTLSIQAEAMLGDVTSGIVYRAFPSDGSTKRVVITLADLPPGVTRIYVNCEGPIERLGGIVLIGDPSVGAGVVRSIATNGAVWLYGDNNQPVAVANESGAWNLTDTNWTEDGSGSFPDLNLAWAGHLFSPGLCRFDTIQLGPTARLNVNGSLTVGTNCEGNISAITVTGQDASPLRYFVERVAYCYLLN